MRKQNILDLLCDDFIKQHNLEQDYLTNSINIENTDKNVKLYIIPYLENTYKLSSIRYNYYKIY